MDNLLSLLPLPPLILIHASDNASCSWNNEPQYTPINSCSSVTIAVDDWQLPVCGQPFLSYVFKRLPFYLYHAWQKDKPVTVCRIALTIEVSFLTLALRWRVKPLLNCDTLKSGLEMQDWAHYISWWKFTCRFTTKPLWLCWLWLSGLRNDIITALITAKKYQNFSTHQSHLWT